MKNLGLDQLVQKWVKKNLWKMICVNKFRYKLRQFQILTASLILEVRGDLFIVVEEVLVEVVVEGSSEIWMMLTVTYVMQKVIFLTTVLKNRKQTRMSSKNKV